MAILTSGQSRIKTSHWYRADGVACHTMPKANGDGERITTIKDAKAQKLLPSVTNILGVLDKPALTSWKIERHLETADKNPRQPDEPVAFWKKRIGDLAYQETADAADLGSKIHAAMERVFDGQPVPEEYIPYLSPVTQWVSTTGILVTAREKRLVNVREGYAGTADVLFTWDNGKGMGILDYKTKRTKPGEKVEAYNEHKRQLAAYAAIAYGAENLDQVLAANIFISSTEPGRMEVIKHTNLQGHYETFLHLCAIWRDEKQYDPRA